ncbi:MAG: aminotransferase class IV [Chitinophagaceae bacterium]
MSTLYTIVNNDLVPAATASLLVSDLAVQRGYGIFDFFKTINGKPVFLDDHLDRFYYSAEQMKLTNIPNRDALKELLDTLLQKNNLPDSGVRITLTGGYSPDGYNIAHPNIVITQQAMTFSNTVPEKGIKLISYEHQRQLPQVKSTDYLVAVWLQSYIREQQADDVLYHWDSNVTECPRSNFYIVTKDNKVLTPEKNVLKGITRKHVLQLEADGIIIKTADITLDDILNAREAFITSTTKAIMPVASFNGNLLGDGKPGEITRTLSKALLEKVYQTS